MKRWLLRTSPTAYAGRGYELVPGESTLVGRSSPISDFVVPDLMMSRYGALFLWRDGAWHCADPGSSHGLSRKGGERFAEARLHDGDVIRVGRIELSIESFEADLLDDVHAHGDGWICFGRRRPPGGRWPAFRRRDGRVERAVLHIDRGDVVVRRDADGVPLPLFAEAVRASAADAASLASVVATELARETSTGEHADLDASSLVVSWDGALVRLPSRRSRRLDGDAIADWLPTETRADVEGTEAFSTERLAEIVRALFPDAWRAELVLREQLDALDDEGVRWLLERNQRTPS